MRPGPRRSERSRWFRVFSVREARCCTVFLRGVWCLCVCVLVGLVGVFGVFVFAFWVFFVVVSFLSETNQTTSCGIQCGG